MACDVSTVITSRRPVGNPSYNSSSPDVPMTAVERWSPVALQSTLVQRISLVHSGNPRATPIPGPPCLWCPRARRVFFPWLVGLLRCLGLRSLLRGLLSQQAPLPKHASLHWRARRFGLVPWSRRPSSSALGRAAALYKRHRGRQEQEAQGRKLHPLLQLLARRPEAVPPHSSASSDATSPVCV